MNDSSKLQSLKTAFLNICNAGSTFILLLTIFFTMMSSSSQGQCEPIEALSCENAPLMELENFCGRTTSIFETCCQGFCGNNTIGHNPTFLKFIALDTFIQLDILVLPCVTGHAIQAALISACPWVHADVLDCHPGEIDGQTIILKSGGITPGNTYWLLIDGSSGAVCNFLITDVTGLSVTGTTEVSLQQVADTLYALPEELPQGNYSFAWFDCDENIVLETSAAFVPPASGCYCVTVRDSATTGTFCTTILLSNNEEIETARISIYPNPSHEILDIEVENPTGKILTVNVINWLGQQVDQFTITDGNHRYTWDNKAPGFYVFRITEGDRTIAFEKVVYSG